MKNLRCYYRPFRKFALMHTLQKPNVLTPCIRLSAVAPQPRAAVRGQPGGKWVGPVGASRGKRGRTGTPGPHWLKAVAALAARWREGERETGADTADSAEQWATLRSKVLQATPRASTRDLGRERPDAERTDLAASPRSPSPVVVRVVDREESADAR